MKPARSAKSDRATSTTSKFANGNYLLKSHRPDAMLSEPWPGDFSDRNNLQVSNKS
jgi:hypothetical protein